MEEDHVRNLHRRPGINDLEFHSVSIFLDVKFGPQNLLTCDYLGICFSFKNFSVSFGYTYRGNKFLACPNRPQK